MAWRGVECGLVYDVAWLVVCALACSLVCGVAWHMVCGLACDMQHGMWRCL